MAEYNVERDEGNFLRDAIFVLRRNFILFLLVVVLVFGGGAVYSYLRKPDYVAKEKMVYTARNLEMDETTYNINAMRAYVKTIIDFCDEGVVVDRANYYYIQFKDKQREKANSDEKYSIKDYVKEIENQEIDTYDAKNYTDKMRETRYIEQDKIGVTGLNNQNEESIQFSFVLTYKDKDKTAVVEKIKLLSLSLSKEIMISEVVDETVQNKYFDTVEVAMKDLGTMPVSPSSSKMKTILVFGVISVVAGVVVVYIKNLLDNTVKTKEDLNRITGVDLLASIDKQGGGK